MGVSTNAIVRKDVTITDIENFLTIKYEDVELHKSIYTPDFFRITFKDGNDDRQLSVSFSDSCEKDYGISGVWLSLGSWGNSIEIMKSLCEEFGGYLDENDCDDEGFYPINLSRYLDGKVVTKMDKFKTKLILEFGHDKLNSLIKLMEEYKDL